MLLGGALSFNFIFPSNEPDIWRLMGMWSIWMFSKLCFITCPLYIADKLDNQLRFAFFPLALFLLSFYHFHKRTTWSWTFWNGGSENCWSLVSSMFLCQKGLFVGKTMYLCLQRRTEKWLFSDLCEVRTQSSLVKLFNFIFPMFALLFWRMFLFSCKFECMGLGQKQLSTQRVCKISCHWPSIWTLCINWIMFFCWLTITKSGIYWLRGVSVFKNTV